MENLGKLEEQVVKSQLDQVARPLELADALKSVLGQSMEEVQTANQNDGFFTPQSQEQKSAKKRASADKQQVYGYMKKKILNHLEKNSCSSSSVNDVIAASKFNRDVILEYLNQRMEMAVMNVHEECESPSFKNIEAWLVQFKKWNLPQSCLYEPALVMNGIANNEDIPPANQLEGIDLRSVYKFLGNALMGLPQPKLNTKTAEFLAKEFEILVSEANTSVGDEHTVLLHNILEGYKELPTHSQTGKCSIDPFCIDDDKRSQQQ
ncbi:uncharacterized protein LOC118745978 isoform X1 [Rhagoletis pomonella]|uniref:uncharacterized protein LOC118745978 isoform X1 n=1 Tax=Rhagoletis pomonella TaxID=28610 RepID=UPI00177FEB88|nr:uncharacterized protein LOC118745978 isoform X1 [Rhagoletis pomonella]